MKLQDWHTHNSMCHHATGALEDYIKRAIDLDLDLIGISDHFPYDYLIGIDGIPIEDYAMILDEVESYISTIEHLKEKYNKKIEIKIGFEIDFIENQVGGLNIHLNKFKSRLDYILGAVHILFTENGPWAMDDNRFIEKYNSIGPDNVFIQYYQTMQKMINSREFDFDIISHFDLPKKFNKLPNEGSKELIMNEVSKTLDLIKKRDLVMEINTAGFRKEIKEQYPSEDILKNMYKLDIPILLGSDAHDPNELIYGFKKIYKILKKLGYNKLASFNKRRRRFIHF